MQSPDELAQEVEFWREFIAWSERKHDRPATCRAVEALAGAEARYYEALADPGCGPGPPSGSLLN